MRSEDVFPSFVAKVLSFVDPSTIRPLRVVIDAANGMAGVMLPPVLQHLPRSTSCAVTSSRTELPGTTSRIHCCPRTAEFIVAKMKESADLGVAYDGDADRCFFVDDTGEFVPGDFATALMAEAVLAKAPGEKVIYDVRASWAVPETIERGGIPLVNRVGHAFIKQRMRSDGAVFARRGVGALLLPRLLPGRYRRRPVPRDARAPVEGRRRAPAPAAVSRALLPHREINTPVADVPLKLQELKGSATRPRAAGSRTSTASRSTSTTGIQCPPVEHRPLLRLNLEALSGTAMVEKRTRCSVIRA